MLDIYNVLLLSTLLDILACKYVCMELLSIHVKLCQKHVKAAGGDITVIRIAPVTNQKPFLHVDRDIFENVLMWTL